MTESQIKIAKILIKVANGEITIAELKRRLTEGIAYIEANGSRNVPSEFIRECAIVENAIDRLERAKARRMNG
jgi:hypothetical protein